jgi:hypothetical protein
MARGRKGKSRKRTADEIDVAEESSEYENSHEEDLDVRVFVNLNSHYSFFCRTRNQKWKSTN